MAQQKIVEQMQVLHKKWNVPTEIILPHTYVLIVSTFHQGYNLFRKEVQKVVFSYKYRFLLIVKFELQADID